jgi:hypothetical protein
VLTISSSLCLLSRTLYGEAGRFAYALIDNLCIALALTDYLILNESELSPRAQFVSFDWNEHLEELLPEWIADDAVQDSGL